jgi:hypothetical protein
MTVKKFLIIHETDESSSRYSTKARHWTFHMFLLSYDSKRKRDEVTGDWRKLHYEELHNLYYSPSIIRMIKSRRMRRAGHLVRTEGHIGYWWESQKERYNWEEQDVGGWTILKWISER